eukprot:TRINITY_DN284_c1_g1_i1.p1 TRINITY_DN284_c1_g1~~TRINITY_DN284_c1_g1_i1.p1  ORF type:complete len:358 (+),score=145.85 TRINITY_DN284_c1_g1_i1:61-1074(+)
MATAPIITRNLLVIDYSTNWYAAFKGKQLNDGSKIKVEQAEWSDISVETNSKEGAIVYIKASINPLPFSTQKEDRSVKPDFILIRNFPTDLHSKDYKNVVMGLMMANIPSINSLHSIFMCMHRVLLYGELLKIQKQLNANENENTNNNSISGPKLELIEMSYFGNEPNSHQRSTLISKQLKFPCVIKVGNTHAGYGKFRIQNQTDFEDMKSIIALNNDYYTMEPMIDKEFEYRIQKIGNHFRCFRRNSSNCWKNNWGNLTFEDHPLEQSHINWAENCSNIFGGLDMLALDVLHTKEGKDLILELNDSSFGLMWNHEQQDIQYIIELVLQKMNQIYIP